MLKYSQKVSEDKAMLIDFSVKNFTSFKNLTTLSAETGERLRKFKETNTFQNKNPHLLKNLLLFGPNGSGKSQLIGALGTMQMIVTRPTHAITDKLFYNPFSFDEQSRNEDTYFNINIEINNKIYEYSFEYNSERIAREVLYTFANDKKIVLFERNDDQVVVKNKTLESSLPKLRKNSLFLYMAQSENDPDAGAVFSWFAKNLIFINNGTGIPMEMIGLIDDEHLKQEMISFLRFADFNITDIKVRELPFPTQDSNFQKFVESFDVKLPEKNRALYTVHKVYKDNKVVSEGELPLSSESIGTQRIFYIVLVMIYAQITGNEKTIIIDEFDDSLHEELTKAMVKVFNSKQNLNQFIVTTHDLQLLDSDLRIDQMYLLEKDFHGISELKSIFDFEDTRNKGRSDISFAKRYMQGRFGAMPVIDVDGLLDVLDMIHKKYGVANGKKKEKA